MLKKNNSENIFKVNLPKKKKSVKKIYKSKSKYDLRRKAYYFITNKEQNIQNIFKLNENKCKVEKNIILTEYSKNNENNSFQKDILLNIDSTSEGIATRERILNYLNITNRLINNKKQNSPILFNMNSKRKLLNVKKEKEIIKNYSYDIKKRILINSKEKRKSTKIKERTIIKEKIQKNFRARNYKSRNIFKKKSRSFDNLNLNIIDINKNKKNKEKVSYIKVNKKNFIKNKCSNEFEEDVINKERIDNNIINNNDNKNSKSIFISKTLENEKRREENKIKNKNKIKACEKKSKEFNIFLDKEFQERFIKKTKAIKVKNDKFNSDNQRKINSILVKKKNYNYNINNISSIASSLSTSNSSHSNKTDWVYRLYNEEIEKRKFENKINKLLRKQILANSNKSKRKTDSKNKTNSRYDEFGNYKNYNTENNFINNLIKSNGNIIKKKRNLCLNFDVNKNKKIEQNKIKLNKRNKRIGLKTQNFNYLDNDELINEEDEEKEIDKEEN